MNTKYSRRSIVSSKIISSVVAISLFIFLGNISVTHAEYAATDVLGQLQAGQPIFTTNNQNNFVTPNDQGLNGPSGSVIDTVNHRLFVADQNNSRVLEYDLDSSDNLIHHYADHVLGQPDFVSRQQNQGGSPASTTMANPFALTYDSSSHRLFVADYSNSRVLVFDTTDGITNDMPAVNVLGQPDFVSGQQNQGGSPASTTMAYPSGLTYDSSSHRLFVADYSNSRVLVFDTTDGITNDMPAVNVLGQPDFVSGNSNQGGSPASTTMAYPVALTYDSSSHRLFVADYSNSRVLVFDTTDGITNDMPAVNVLGQPDFVSSQPGDPGDGGITASTTMANPFALTYDSSSHRLFVADYSNSRVLVFDTTDGITNDMPAVNVLGQPDFVSGQQNQGGSPASTTMAYPSGLTYDSSSHRLFVADYSNSRVLVFDTTDGITNDMPATDLLGQIDGNGNVDFTTSAPDETAFEITNTGLSFPTGSTIDTVNHRLFVVDQNNSRVLEYDLDSSDNLIHHYADHVLGQPDFVSGNNNQGGSPASTTMSYPYGLTYDSSFHRLFVADLNNSRVLVFDTTDGITNDMPAVNVLGQPDFVSNSYNQGGSPASTTMVYPFALTYDSSSHRLFVADQGNSRVLVFDTTDGITNDMPAVNVLGQPDFVSGNSNQGGSPASTTMAYPVALTYDSSSHRLFVADQNNHRVLVFDTTDGITNDMPAVNVLGQPDFVSNSYNQGGGSTSASTTMGYPAGLSYDPSSKKLFLADSDGDNNRILIYDLSNGITNDMPATDLIGQPDFVSESSNQGGSPASTTISNAFGVTYDSFSHRLFVADTNNSRVLVFDVTSITQPYTPPTPPSTPTPPAPSGGGSSGGGSVSSAVLASLLAPSATTTAYLATYTVPGCPVGFTCKPIPGFNPATTPTFTRNLTLGSTGADVKALQVYLNNHGFTISVAGAGSLGNESDYFGYKTQAALSKFQKAHGITPAVGYFGPITRAWANGH